VKEVRGAGGERHAVPEGEEALIDCFEVIFFIEIENDPGAGLEFEERESGDDRVCEGEGEEGFSGPWVAPENEKGACGEEALDEPGAFGFRIRDNGKDVSSTQGGSFEARRRLRYEDS